jgi:hypothetical protein
MTTVKTGRSLRAYASCVRKRLTSVSLPAATHCPGGARSSTHDSSNAATTGSNYSNSVSNNVGNTAADGAAADLAPLPEAWDWSVMSLRAALARLSSSSQQALRQAGAVLGQQGEVALRGAAVPEQRSDMVAAACR